MRRVVAFQAAPTFRYLVGRESNGERKSAFGTTDHPRIVENWALLRDARRWDRFRELWHEEGRMITTWIEGSFEEFIKASQAGYDKGVRFLHFLGGTTIDLKRNRAIAQTKQMISYRVAIDGVLCDVVCTGRFYFFLEKRKGRWGIVLFQPILEKDRLDPVDPSATLKLDGELLARYPEGYRHLAYSLVRAGQKVRTDVPGLDGPALDAVYARGAAWLAGKPLQMSA
jgi:SnoaL-like domain